MFMVSQDVKMGNMSQRKAEVIVHIRGNRKLAYGQKNQFIDILLFRTTQIF